MGTNKHTEILQHQITFWLRDADDQAAPDELDDCSVEHIGKLIAEGYNQGELCVLGDEGDTEFRGWWSITGPEGEAPQGPRRGPPGQCNRSRGSAVSAPPWTVGERLNDGSIPVVDSNGRIVAKVLDQDALYGSGFILGNQEANARLLASAHVMQQALAMQLTANTLIEWHGDVWGACERYPREDWEHEVVNNATNLGYWEWVIHQAESDGVVLEDLRP